MIDWSLEKVGRLTELVCDENGYSEYQISDILTEEFNEPFSRDAVHNKILRLSLRTLVDKDVTDIMPYFTKYKQVIEDPVGVTKLLDFPVDNSYIEFDTDLKILHLSDLHVPFQLDEQIQEAANKNINTDVVVVSELLDCYALSRFGKTINVPFEVEIDNAIRMLEYLSNTFPLVFIFAGNHEKRIKREGFKQVPPSLLFLIEENIVRQIAKPFENIVVVDTPLLQINDAVFTHAEVFSKLDMKAGMSVYQYLKEWQDVLELPKFRIVVQSHTHMVGSAYRGGGAKIIESGCLCRVPDYAVDGFYSKPQTNGYVVLNQKDGESVLNLCREYVFPTQTYMRRWSPVGWSSR